jgi:5'-nucleotidase
MKRTKENPLIFITNDDGPNTIGLNKLIDIVKVITNNYIVVIPEKNCSGFGHSITLSRPLRLNKVNDKFYTCDGTPTDCVMLGFFKILKGSPDLLLSGINMGENLADDATYSGTLSAALEGSLRNIKSVALSKVISKNNIKNDWSAIDDYLPSLILNILKMNIHKNNFFNVNFPNIISKKIKNIKLTHLARRKPVGNYIVRKDAKNIPYYWLTTERSKEEKSLDSDIWALKNNYISITPLNSDMTENVCFNNYKDQFNKN